jgi:hypothetical protein
MFLGLTLGGPIDNWFVLGQGKFAREVLAAT